MNTIKRIVISASALLLGLVPAMAQQDFQTGYFLGGYQYAYRLNPAFQGEQNFLAVGVGNVGLNTTSNVGITDFLYVKNGKTVTFLNDAVTAAEFLGNINPINSLDASANVNLFSSGSWKKDKNQFSTFDITLKSANSVSLPADLFRFLKEGTANGTTFDLSGTGVRSNNYLEIAYGVSRNFNNLIAIGVRLKGLVGLADLNAKMENLTMTLANDKWQFKGDGKLLLSSPAVTMQTKADGTYDYSTIGLPSPITSKLAAVGLGGAIDAGVSINLLPWITLSAAVLDFGVMRWGHEIVGVTDSAGYTWEPSKGEEIDLMGGESGGSGMDGEMDKIKEALSNMYQFKAADPEVASKFESIPFRFNAGLEIRVPFYQRLSVGALYTLNNMTDFSALTQVNTNNLRFSANWTPLNFISASVSTTMSEAFKSYGAALNIHPLLFINLFAGIDLIPTNTIAAGPLLNDLLPAAVQPYSKYIQVPADDLNVNAYVGLSFSLGKRQVDYRKLSRQIIQEKKEKEAAKVQEKKEKEEQKAKQQQLKEYEKLQAEEAKAAEKQAKEDAKAAKEAEKAAAAQAKEDAKAAKIAEKEAKEQAAAEAKATKEAAAKAKADAKAAKEAEKAAKAQEKAAKAAEKAAAKNAEVDAALEEYKAKKAAKEEEVPAQEVSTEATAAESLLESVLENKTEEPAPAAEEPKAEEPKVEDAPAAPAPTVFEFPNL